MPDSPGNNGDPVSNSAMTHPVDQISTINTQSKTDGGKREGGGTNECGIIRSAKDEFWSTIISRTDVTDVWFSLDENLCTSEIA
jgi:hypothetical protein